MSHQILKRLLFIAALACCLQAGAYDYAAHSALAKGRWVKIRVDSTSVYRLNHELLRRWGFNDPAGVRIYGYGGVEQAHLLDTAPDDLPQIPGMHIGDALYFYGEAGRRISLSSDGSVEYVDNYYSDSSYYFLSDTTDDDALSLPQIGTASPVEVIDTHTSVDLRTPHDYNVHEGSVFFFSPNIANRSGGYDVFFAAPAYVSGGKVAYRYIYRHNEATPQALHMEFTGDVTPGAYSLGAVRAMSMPKMSFSRAQLKTIDVTPASERGFGMHFSVREDSKFEVLALSEMMFTYQRANELGTEPLAMRYAKAHVPSGIRLHVADGLTYKADAVQLWDVSNPRHPSSFLLHKDDTSGALLANTSSCGSETSLTLCAFVPGDGVPSPVYDGEVMCRDLHAFPSVDYLIVTTETLRGEAERLAAAHESMQGLRVGVVSQDEVFNEFSSGTSHPNGLRKFVRMLSQRTDRPLRYLLLLGAATYDPRGMSDNDEVDYLVSYAMENFTQSRFVWGDYSTDLYFAFPDDRIPETLSDLQPTFHLSVGRLPVRSSVEAAAVVDKSIAWLSDPRAFGRPDRVVLACGGGDSDAHLLESERLRDIISDSLPAATVSRLYPSLYPMPVGELQLFSRFSGEISRGPMFVNYTGHAVRSSIGKVLSMAVEKELAYGSMPIMYFAACETSPNNSFAGSLGTQCILNPKGPAVVIGSGLDVFMDNNHSLNEAFVKELFSEHSSARRVGDVWLRAVNANMGSSSIRTNTFCYNFFGDPALPLRRPSREVALVSVNGMEPNGAINLSALSAVSMEGTINRQDGSADSAFDGTVMLTLYDAPTSRRRYEHHKGDSTEEMILDETPLLEFEAEIRGGRWSMDFIVPRPVHPGSHRLTFLAYSETGDVAIGRTAPLAIEEHPADCVTDSEAPVISLFVDSPDMADGDIVGSTPTLIASVNDNGSGVDFNSASVGGSIRLMLDSVISLTHLATPLLRTCPDGSASLECRMPHLSDGRHTLSLTARDVAGNSATRSLSFIVDGRPVEAVLSVDSVMVRDNVTFSLSHDLSHDPEARLVVRDMAGSTVWSSELVGFPYEWNLCGNGGEALADGCYRVSAVLKGDGRYGATPEISFVIARKQY